MSGTWINPTVSYTVEVAFDSGPWADDPWSTAVDVSEHVRYVESFRGTTSEALVIGPGTMRVTFANADRRFDPENAAGPHYGHIVPMKRIRFRATRSAVTFTVFQGWVTGWQQDWQVGDGVAYANVVDGGRFLQSESLAASAYDVEVLADSPAHLWRLRSDFADALNPDSASLVPFTDDPYAMPAFVDGVGFPVGADQALAGSQLWQALTPGETGDPATVEFVMSASGATDSAFGLGVVDVEISDSSYIAGIRYVAATGTWTIRYENQSTNTRVFNFTPRFPLTGAHHVAVTFSASLVTLYVDGVSVATHVPAFTFLSGGTAGFRIIAQPNARVSNLATYATAPSATRIQAHYLAGLHAHGHPINEEGGLRIERMLDEVGYPSNLRDIATGGTVQGPYVPAGRQLMDCIYEVVASERGLVFFSADGKLTFRDRHWQQISADADGVVFSDDGAAGSIRYTNGSPNAASVDTVRNIVTCSYSTVGAITRRDAASIAAYGASREFIDAPTLRNGTDASNLAAYVLRLGKDGSQTIPRLTVQLRRDVATYFAKVLGLELGEVVTVERTPMGVGSQIVKRYQVLGIAHTVTPDNWTTEFYLSPAVPMADEAPYFTVGHATYGRVGASAGNATPF